MYYSYVVHIYLLFFVRFRHRLFVNTFQLPGKTITLISSNSIWLTYGCVNFFFFVPISVTLGQGHQAIKAIKSGQIAGKTFPAFPVHAQPVNLRFW